MAGFSFTPDNAAGAAPVPPTPAENFAKYGTTTGPDTSVPTFSFKPDVAPPRETRGPVQTGGHVFPDALQGTVGLGGVQDFATGFNDMLGSALGVAPEAADSLLKHLGSSGFLAQPGDATKAIKKSMDALGFDTKTHKAVSELAANLGGQTFQQAALLSTLFAMAPAMAAKEGTDVASMIIRSLGQTTQAMPGATVLSAVAAPPGGAVGEAVLPGAIQTGVNVASDITGQAAPQIDPKLLGQIGNVAGQFAGAGVGGTVASLGRVRPGLTGLPRVGGQNIPLPKDALTKPNPDMSPIASAISGYKLKITRAMNMAMSSVKATNDPAKAGERLRKGLQTGYKLGRQAESKLWGAVNLKRPVPTNDIKALGQTMIKELGTEVRPEFLPTGMLARIRALPKQMTIERFRDFRRLALAELGNMSKAKDVVPNDTLRRNYNRIQEELLNSVTKAYPQDTQLAQAREYSRWLHDKFSRGTLSDYARVREIDASLPGAEDATAAAVRKEGLGQGIQDVSGTLGAPSLAGRGEDYIRARFQQAAQASGDMAMKFLETPQIKRFIKAFPKLDDEMTTVGQRLARLTAEQDTVNKSAFFRLGSEQPQTAASKIMNSANRVKSADEVMRRIAPDAEALDALQHSVINDLYAGAKFSPSQVKMRLEAKDTGAAVHRILGTEKYARLMRQVNAAAGIENGGEAFGKRAVRATTSKAGRILGAVLARNMGSNTLQTQAIGAQAGQAFMEGIFHMVPPDVLLARAATDPRWERFLFSRLPSNVEEYMAANKQLRALVGGMEATTKQGLDFGQEQGQ